MDEEPPPREIHKDVMQVIQDNWRRLQREWNRIHPNNPVDIDEGEENDDAG
jgi:hypothetical protein